MTDLPVANEAVALSTLQEDMRSLILSDTPEGFEAYFEAVFNQPFPPHARTWIRKLYEAHNNKTGYVEEAFRFSWKTSVLTVGFLSYRVGLEPNRSSIIIQVKDESAELTAASVARVIAENPVFRWLFPNIEPDPAGRGWATRGYFVKRNDMEYGEWLRQCGRDPTFVGYGYTSDSIIGKHPNGCLIVDDIHNESNTASAKELQTVIDILTGTIFPTIDPKQTWVVFVGTPWVKNDTLGYVKATGAFVTDQTPIYKLDQEKNTPIYTWPEKFDEAEVDRLRKLSGPVEFNRMYMCDISAAEGLELRKEWLMYYPDEKIGTTWPVFMGVDYANLSDPKAPSYRDYFALAVGAAIPGGGLILIDGVYDRLTQAEAENRLRSYYRLYPTTQAIGFETLGKGEVAYQVLLQTSNLPLVPTKVGNMQKRHRYGKILAPAFQTGRIKLSDKPHPFLTAFRNEWLSFPVGEHDDALDAVFHLAQVAISPLLTTIPADEETLQLRKRKPSIWASMYKENR